MGQDNTLARDISVNLSFALPSPWGPVAAAGLTGLFDLFGGEDANVVAALIQAAVNELESYMRQLDLTSALGDAAAFFNWYAENRPDDVESRLTAAAVTHIETILLPELEKANSYVHGSLAANLATYSNSTFIQADFAFPPTVERSTDLALIVLMMTMTALLAALKLQIQLRAGLASYYAPDPVTGTCVSADADGKFQDSMYEWIWAVAQLHQLIGTPDRLSRLTGDHLAQVQAGLATGDAVVDFLTADSADTRAAIVKFAGYVPGDPVNMARVGWLGLKARPSGSSFDLNGLAMEVGWAAGLRLLLERRMVSWGTAFIAPDFMGGGGFNVQELPEVGLGKYPNQAAAIGPWLDYLKQRMTPHVVADGDNPSYAGDFAITKAWQDGLAKLLTQMPLPAPANALNISAWGADPPAANSQWKTARRVQYALSYTNANGPSQRSAWSAALDVNQRWKPALHHIEDNPDSSRKIQIWRQFIFNDSHGDPQAFGLPAIVATVSGTTTQYTDSDPALVSAAAS